MFWNPTAQVMTRNAEAELADLAAARRSKRARKEATPGEARTLSIGPVEWMAEYERKADERKAAWESSPFYDVWCDLLSRAG